MNFNINWIKDKLGGNYIGIDIKEESIQKYLTELKLILKDEYETYREYQSRRDSGKFHLTIINTNECNKLLKDISMVRYINLAQEYIIDDLKMIGVGRATKNENIAYFIICRSEKLDYIREHFGLNKKDFHITIGFLYNDVFGVPKNEIYKHNEFYDILYNEYNRYNSFEFLRGLSGFPKCNDEIIPVKLTDSILTIKCNDYNVDITNNDGLFIGAVYKDDKQKRISISEFLKIITK